MAEPAPDKNVVNENNSDTSLPDRDTDDISVDLVDQTDINQKTCIFSENNAENPLGTVENALEVESEIVEEINILAVDEVNADESKEPHENEHVPIVPIEDPFEKATKYLAKHNIIGLFQNITADIAYRKPDEPIQFMIDEIEKLQEIDRRRKGVILRKSPETKNGASRQNQSHEKNHISKENYNETSET